MTLTHRHDDTNGRDHSVEREWTGPSRDDWELLMLKVDNIGSDVGEIQKAMWGDRKAGMDNDGGLMAEVQKQKSVRMVAWSSICIAVSTTFTLILGWAWGKITKGE